MISFLALTLCASPQAPIEDTQRLKPLVPAPTTAEAPAPSPPVKAKDKPALPLRPQLGPPPAFGAGEPNGGMGVLSGLGAGQPQAQDSGTGPRPLDPRIEVPFNHNRSLLRVNGVEIRASEINELVLYYRSYRPGRSDMQLIEAVNALLPMKVMSAHFKADIPAMIDQVDAAYAAIVDGEDFASVAARYSEDSEATNAEGRYTFGRGKAVQPFDRLSFSTPLHQLTPPFLTVYGFHLLEVVDYERTAMPSDDQSTMRHILIMYPGMIALENQGKDVRKWIKQQLKEAKIEVLEAGMENLVPAAYRSQIVQSH